MPPQSQLLAYGPASPVNRSLELVLRSRRRLRAASGPVRHRPQRPGTGHTRFDAGIHAERCSPSVRLVPTAPHFNPDNKRASMEHRPAGVSVLPVSCVAIGTLDA